MKLPYSLKTVLSGHLSLLKTRIQHFQRRRKNASREISPTMSQKPRHISDNLCYHF